MNWKKQEARSSRARNVARIEAIMLLTGVNPRTEANTRILALTYRADQEIPVATFKRWRKQTEAQRLVEQELAKLLEQQGLTRETFLERLEAAWGDMTTDSGRLGWLDRVGRLVDVPLDRGEDGSTYSRDRLLYEPYTPPQIGYNPPRQIGSYEDGEDAEYESEAE